MGGTCSSQQLGQDVEQALGPSNMEKAPKKSEGNVAAALPAEKAEVVSAAPEAPEEPEPQQEPDAGPEELQPPSASVEKEKEATPIAEPAEEKAAEPNASEETSDATRKAEAWTFSMNGEQQDAEKTPAQRLKAACMQFRPEIMKLPGARGIRVKTTEQGPIVILRISYRQPEWDSAELPACLQADPEVKDDYLLVNGEGASIMVGETAARIRVVRKQPKLACLAEPENHIGEMTGGCLKGEEPAEPLLLEGKAMAADSLARMTAEEEAQPPTGMDELAQDLAEADLEEQAKGEQGEPTQPTDV